MSGPSIDSFIKLFRFFEDIEFLRAVLIMFCLLNLRSHSAVDTGATSNLPAASAAAGYTSLCLRAKLITSREDVTDYYHLTEGSEHSSQTSLIPLGKA